MKKSLHMGSAFIGIMVGAGFASGQEILQYFTSYGKLGLLAAITSTFLIAYLGMNLMKLGSIMQTASHKDVIYGLSGKYVGRLMDFIIILTLFGVSVVMFAGAGAIGSQQFGLTATHGSTVMAGIVIFTVLLNVQKIITIIGAVTPFLVLAILFVFIYSISTVGMSISELHILAIKQPTAMSNWFFSAVNYVSYNIAAGAAMIILMGGTEKDEKIAANGGLIGGLGLGFLIILSYLTIFLKIDLVDGYDMPLLKIADDIHPTLGISMSLILFVMIYNTAVGALFSFSARFVNSNTPNFKVHVILSGIIAYVSSSIGFTTLVSMFYPVVGYLGLFLIGTILFASFKRK